jgi:hypothetical protein
MQTRRDDPEPTFPLFLISPFSEVMHATRAQGKLAGHVAINEVVKTLFEAMSAQEGMQRLELYVGVVVAHEEDPGLLA